MYVLLVYIYMGEVVVQVFRIIRFRIHDLECHSRVTRVWWPLVSWLAHIWLVLDSSIQPIS